MLDYIVICTQILSCHKEETVIYIPVAEARVADH